MYILSTIQRKCYKLKLKAHIHWPNLWEALSKTRGMIQWCMVPILHIHVKVKAETHTLTTPMGGISTLPKKTRGMIQWCMSPNYIYTVKVKAENTHTLNTPMGRLRMSTCTGQSNKHSSQKTTQIPL